MIKYSAIKKQNTHTHTKQQPTTTCDANWQIETKTPPLHIHTVNKANDMHVYKQF